MVKNERIGTCKNGILVNDGLIGFVQGILKWLKMYKTFPEIVDTACRQSNVLLSWSHYRTLLQVKDPEARAWYEKEAQNSSGVFGLCNATYLLSILSYA